MFLRTKTVRGQKYLQLVENRWQDGRSRQRVLASLGRLEDALSKGSLDALLASGAKLSETVMVLSAQRQGEAQTVRSVRIGPSLIFERLWQETGCAEALGSLLGERKFEFPVERTVFTEVLHRLIAPGSDRDCTFWKDAYAIPAAEDVCLHHSYRAMAWLGEAIDNGTLAPRCTKDLIEERLFERRRDLFSSLELVFFDTTSIYFEGSGGQELGARGYSKDHRPDLNQMVVGVVINEEGWPICCEMWPGNTADSTTVLPIVDRLKKRFGISRVCFVADRGMISAGTLAELEKRGLQYIIGARMRSQKEVREDVLERGGRYRVVVPRQRKERGKRAPSPLKVKDIEIDGRRYVVCVNEDQAKKDAADRQAIVAALERKLKQGPKALVGNTGYRRYVAVDKGSVSIDQEKIEAEARFDGTWVLRTNTDLDAAEVAFVYRQLWQVEDVFRSMKSLLSTRPIYHRTDDAIRGHVFCSFLALLLRAELQQRLADKGFGHIEWRQLLRDLDRLELLDIEKDGKTFRLRTQTVGVTGKVFQAVGVALPPTLQKIA